jgi:CRISPR/Cas system Type II protein with McrA/HNH and RuvC-like nuclease domain
MIPEESPVKPMNIVDSEDRAQLAGRRRESSYTDALDDPLRYLDQVKKFLGTAGEDEDLIATVQKSKAPRRTSSGNGREDIEKKHQTLLEEIDEEAILPVETIKPKEVDFIKN